MTSTASSDGAVWTATLSTLRHHHAEVRDAVMRMAVVHWFDHRMISAVAGVAPPPSVLNDDKGDRLPADLVMTVVESLPFVEAHGEARLRLHTDVRRILLQQLLRTDPGFIEAISRTVVSEFRYRNEANDGLDVDELLELAYLLLATEAEEGAQLVDEIFASQGDFVAGGVDITIAAIDRLMLYVGELSQQHRLPAWLAGRCMVWSVWAATAAGEFARAAGLAQQALRDHGAERDVADDLAYHLAFVRWQLGDAEEARRLAEDLVDRSQGTRLCALAAMLLGDMATSPEQSCIAYGAALHKLLRHHVPDVEGVGTNPEVWWADVDELTADEEPAANVFVGGDEDTVYKVPGDGLYADLWLRLGEVDYRRGRPVDAMAWIERARRLFGALEDLQGVQRAEGVEQRLAADYGDLQRLRAIIEGHEAMLAWAHATGAAQHEMQALLDLGNAYWRLGDVNQAQERYQAAEQLAESLGEQYDQAVAAEGLAQVAIAQKRFDDADRYLEAANAAYAQAGSEEAVRRLNLLVGERWLAANEPALARNAYEEMLAWASSHELADDEVAARVGLAGVARRTFALDEAALQLETALTRSPEIDPVAKLDLLMQRATVLRLQRRDVEAWETEHHVEEQAGRLGVRSMLGWLLVNRGDMAGRRSQHIEAASAYREALRLLDPDEIELMLASLSGLATSLSELNQHEDALEAARQAMEFAASSARPDWEVEALQTLATALVEAGEVDEAITLLVEAHRRQPDNSGVCTNLGWAYLRAGMFDMAVEWSRRALDIDPADAFPYRNIGHGLLGLGRLDEARDAYHKAIEGRFGDEGFRNTLDELQLLGRHHPGLKGLDEAIGLFRAEQAKLEASSPDTPRVVETAPSPPSRGSDADIINLGQRSGEREAPHYEVVMDSRFERVGKRAAMTRGAAKVRLRSDEVRNDEYGIKLRWEEIRRRSRGVADVGVSVDATDTTWAGKLLRVEVVTAQPGDESVETTFLVPLLGTAEGVTGRVNVTGVGEWMTSRVVLPVIDPEGTWGVTSGDVELSVLAADHRGSDSWRSVLQQLSTSHPGYVALRDALRRRGTRR